MNKYRALQALAQTEIEKKNLNNAKKTILANAQPYLWNQTQIKKIELIPCQLSLSLVDA